jgi:hypothetical protein
MSSIVLSGDTSGTVTVSVPAVAGTNTATIPAATGTIMVSGNMPAFSYYQSSTQTLATSTYTKITFTTSEFDTTGGMYSSSRFTPTVAGYYQVNAGVAAGSTVNNIAVNIYKNGASYKQSPQGATLGGNNISALVYLNGSTDYIEIYASFSVGQVTYASLQNTFFQAAMVRSA